MHSACGDGSGALLRAAAQLAEQEGLTQLSMGMSGDYETGGNARRHSHPGRYSTVRRARVTAVILDFDGVIADSEVLANRILAEVLTENGFPTTAEDSIRHYMGLRWEDTLEPY